MSAMNVDPNESFGIGAGASQAKDQAEEEVDLSPENLNDFLPEAQPKEIRRIFQYIDSQRQRYVETLREAVAIRSVSSWPEARNEVVRMIQWTANKLKELEFEVELRKTGEQSFADGLILPIPPIILATLGSDPAKRTLLIYGHLDVHGAKREDGWDSDPFLLIEQQGQLYGRGASDDKGPILGWFHAIESYQKQKIDIPINIKFVLESMEESESAGLAELLKAQKDGFLANVDLVCISDNYWLGRSKPCLTYGLRGLCYFFVEVEGGSKDLHSGVFGGTVREAMPDLIYLLNSLIESDGTIMIPGIMDNVCPATFSEEEMYNQIDFDLNEYQCDIGVPELLNPGDKVKTLMNRWRNPALSIHGIQGAFGTPGAKTVIPRKVIGKFSIRIVPNQTPEEVNKLVTTFLRQKWEERNSSNSMKCYMADDGLPTWTANPLHPGYRAARGAVAMVYRQFPDMIREGGFMTQVLQLQEVTGKNVLILPMGSSDDGAHAHNEKLETKNYLEGTKVMAAYIWQVGQIAGRL